MTIDLPLVVIIVAIVFFYLKLAWMQWRKARVEGQKAKSEMVKARKEGRKYTKPEKPVDKFAIKVRSWPVVAIALALMIVPWALFSADASLLGEVTNYWWVSMAVGIVILAFTIK
jgi:uncharacterized ion transporter superfamily protein YfcC